MRRSILAMMILPMFTAVTSGGQLCSQQPFSESFGYSSEDSGGGSYLGVDTRDLTPDRLSVLKLKEEHGVEVREWNIRTHEMQNEIPWHAVRYYDMRSDKSPVLRRERTVYRVTFVCRLMAIEPYASNIFDEIRSINIG